MSSTKTVPAGQSQLPAGQSRQSAPHRQVDTAHVCPVCSSGSRSHELVVTDENGEWHIRSVRD
jgi:hypothetical protein